MIGLVVALLFAGYTLVYAAVANGGKFAATPWEALRTDAYTGARPGAAGGPSPAGGTHHSSSAVGAIESVIGHLVPFGGLLP